MARYIADTPLGKKRDALYANGRKEVSEELSVPLGLHGSGHKQQGTS